MNNCNLRYSTIKELRCLGEKTINPQEKELIESIINEKREWASEMQFARRHQPIHDKISDAFEHMEEMGYGEYKEERD